MPLTSKLFKQGLDNVTAMEVSQNDVFRFEFETPKAGQIWNVSGLSMFMGPAQLYHIHEQEDALEFNFYLDGLLVSNNKVKISQDLGFESNKHPFVNGYTITYQPFSSLRINYTSKVEFKAFTTSENTDINDQLILVFSKLQLVMEGNRQQQ